MINVGLLGNPNSGKTTLFNILTGSTAHTGNWPGVTVEKKAGVYKKKGDGEPISLIDLPGIYSLSPYTPEEVVSRNYIVDEKPDCVINIVDATNLERNLYLTTQALEMDVPIVIALNMVDEVNANGDSINVDELEEKIGVPVVAISALKGTGITELMDRVAEVAKTQREGTTVLQDEDLLHLIGDIRIGLKHKDVSNTLFHAIKLIEKDEIEVKAHKDLVGLVDDFKATFNNDMFGADFECIIADARYKYIENYYTPAYHTATQEELEKKAKQEAEKSGKKVKKVKSRKGGVDANGLTLSDRIDKVLTNKWASIPIFLLILFAIFHITFSENFLFLGAIPAIGGFVSGGAGIEGVFVNGAIMSPGVVLQGLMGALTDAIGNGISMGLEAISSPEWVVGLLVDGVWGGLAAVMSFLPQILLLFLLFSILEDSGYMARVAYILDRLFRKFGVSGRAFLPMIMGFGCSVPAMINTRTLADDKERIVTLRTIPFFSCGAKLPILTCIAGAIAETFHLPGVDFITFGMYVIGIAVAFVAILLMRNTTQSGAMPPFLMELPTYRAPKFTSLMLLLWDKMKHFIKKAFTIILASTIIIWVISHFSFAWEFLPDARMEESILAGIGKLIQPIFTPLGFGSQLGNFGWVFAVAAITGLIAKENVIATIGTLAAVVSAAVGSGVIPGLEEGVGEMALLVTATGITVPALLAFIAFNMTTIPCFAAVATARAEMPNKKAFNWTLLFWIVTSYLVGSVIYLTGQYYWPIAIFIAVAVLVGVGIFLYKKRPGMLSKIKLTKKGNK